MTRQGFFVESGEDRTPPRGAGLGVEPAVGYGHLCQDIVGGQVSWDGGRSDESTVEIELARDGATFARLFPAGRTFGTSPDPECFGGGHVDGLIEGEELTARVRLWDMAGNATDFVTSPFTVGHSRAFPAELCGPRYCSAGAWARGRRAELAWSALVLLPLVRGLHRARRTVRAATWSARKAPR